MKKASAHMVQRGGGRHSKNAEGVVVEDRSSVPAKIGHDCAGNKKFQYAANWLLQSLLKPFIPKKVVSNDKDVRGEVVPVGT